MNAIIVSYTSSDSEDETDSTQVQNSKKQPDFSLASAQNSRKQHDAFQASTLNSRKQHDSLQASVQNSRKQHEALQAGVQSSRKHHDALQAIAQSSRKQHDSLQASAQNSRKQHDPLQQSVQNTRKRHDALQASAQNPRKQHDSLQASVQNSRKKQPSHDRDKARDVTLAVLLKQAQSLDTAQSAGIPAILIADGLTQHTAGTVNQSAMNTVRTKRTNTVSRTKAQQDLDSSVFSLKKDTVMPYIPKSKRTKYAAEQKTAHAVSSNSFPNSLSSVFKKAKILSKNISRYYSPKRKLFHFDAHDGCINRISWNPCFQDFLLSASMDSVVKIWNVETTASCVLQVRGHTQAVKDVKWSIDGLKVLSCGYDKFSRITDINIGKEVYANKHNSFVTCVLYHPSDPNVYLSGTSNDGIFAWDVRMPQYVCRYKSFFGQIQDLAFLPDGQSFISAAEISRRNSTDKGIMVWDYNTSTVLSNQVFQEGYTCTALQIHPNDSTFLARCNAGYIAVFSQKSPYKLNKYKRFEGHCVSGYHIGMDISPDGSLVASGSSDGSLFVYNYHTSEIIKTFLLDSQPCMDVVWSPTVASLLASCDWSGKIFLHR